MTSSVSRKSPDHSLGVHIELEQWVSQHGGRLDDSVRFAHDSARGVHLQAKPAEQVRSSSSPSSGVPPGTCVMKIPIELTMSYFDAIDYNMPDTSAAAATAATTTTPFCSHGVIFPKSFMEAIGPEEAFSFFLMGQYLRGQDGFWYPYIRSLPGPGDLTTPLFFEEGQGDLEWLNGTSLAVSRERRLQIWKANYEKGHAMLKELGFEVVHLYTWDLYLWASTIISSRAFTAKVLASVIPTLQRSEDQNQISVLLPLIDATNHKPLSKVEWRAGPDSIGLVVMSAVEAGQEVGNNYGPRNNEQQNPCEYRIVSLRAPPDSPLAQIQAQYEQHFPKDPKTRTDGTNQEDKYYVFSLAYPLLDSSQALESSIFSSDLLRALSIIVANDRELETVQINEDGFQMVQSEYAASRNLIASLNQIVIELLSYIQRLEASGSQLGEPSNLKQSFAKQFRESHINLSKIAVFIANWTITRSRTIDNDREEELLNELLSRFSQCSIDSNKIEKIRERITSRKSLLPKHHSGELVSFQGLLQLLPSSCSEIARNCLESLTRHVREAITFEDDAADEPEDGSEPHGLLSYAIFINLVVAMHKHNSAQLSNRLNAWCDFLLDTYPPPPNDVSWTLPDKTDEVILWAYDSFINEHLDAEILSPLTPWVGMTIPNPGERDAKDWWLSPNRLRWAWLILEQEMIRNVVDDPVKEIINGPSRAMKMSSLLYVPNV